MSVETPVRVGEIAGILTERLADRWDAGGAAYRKTCTQCGTVKVFRKLPGMDDTDTFIAHVTWGPAHRAERHGPVAVQVELGPDKCGTLSLW